MAPFASLTFVKAARVRLWRTCRRTGSRPGLTGTELMSRSGTRRWFREVLFRIVLVLSLAPLVTPGLLAFSADDGIWCESLASLDAGADRGDGTGDDGDCLVCLVVALGGQTASPAAIFIPAPRNSVLTAIPVSLAGSRGLLAEACPPIRAPPLA